MSFTSVHMLENVQSYILCRYVHSKLIYFVNKTEVKLLHLTLALDQMFVSVL